MQSSDFLHNRNLGGVQCTWFALVACYALPSVVVCKTEDAVVLPRSDFLFCDCTRTHIFRTICKRVGYAEGVGAPTSVVDSVPGGCLTRGEGPLPPPPHHAKMYGVAGTPPLLPWNKIRPLPSRNKRNKRRLLAQVIDPAWQAQRECLKLPVKVKCTSSNTTVASGLSWGFALRIFPEQRKLGQKTLKQREQILAVDPCLRPQSLKPNSAAQTRCFPKHPIPVIMLSSKALPWCNWKCVQTRLAVHILQHQFGVCTELHNPKPSCRLSSS